MNLFSVMVSLDIYSIIICMVLLYANIFDNHQKSKRSIIYSIMVITLIITLFFDCLSWIYDGRADRILILYISNCISMLGITFILLEFTAYINYYLIDRTHKPSISLYRIALVFIGLFILVTIMGCLTGKMFTIDNATFAYGPMFAVYTIDNIIGILICIFVVLFYRKNLGLHDTIVSLIYLIIPTLGGLVNVFGFDLTYSTCSLGLFILYILMQTENTGKLEYEKNISLYYANHDDLTNLNSRRLYVEKIEELKNSDGNVGIVFCDVNGLKYTNDHYGHKAGDDLLISFANLLSNTFNIENVYRISGDEFIVIIQTDETNFNELVKQFKSHLIDNDKEIASYGSQYGACIKIEELISMSETIMYKAKDEYHLNHPELKR